MTTDSAEILRRYQMSTDSPLLVNGLCYLNK
jgi:hypothetical protein